MFRFHIQIQSPGGIFGKPSWVNIQVRVLSRHPNPKFQGLIDIQEGFPKPVLVYREDG